MWICDSCSWFDHVMSIGSWFMFQISSLLEFGLIFASMKWIWDYLKLLLKVVSTVCMISFSDLQLSLFIIYVCYGLNSCILVKFVVKRVFGSADNLELSWSFDVSLSPLIHYRIGLSIPASYGWVFSAYSQF